MASFFATNGVTTYTGTSDDDYFKFSTEYDARYFDIGTTVDGGLGTNEVDFSFRSSTATNVILDLVTGFSEGGVTYVTFTNIQDASISNLSRTESYTVNGTSGNNVLSGGGGDDIINGRKGADTLSGGGGIDILNGGWGNDTFIGSFYASAFSTMRGNKGNDTYRILTDNAKVVERAGQGLDTVEAGITYKLGKNVENLTLTGETAIDGTGNALNNKITGNDHANTLKGGGGVDTLDGGKGADTMIGAAGKTTYIIDNLGDVVTEKGSDNNDQVKTKISYALGRENTAGNDNVEQLKLMGKKSIHGTGNDLNNEMIGNAGNNKLIGNAGIDKHTGGKGNDTFVFGDKSGLDLIRDFDAKNNAEKIHLTGVSAIKDFQDLKANHMVQQGSDVYIGFSGSEGVLLHNVKLKNLDAKDFVFGNMYAVGDVGVGDARQVVKNFKFKADVLEFHTAGNASTKVNVRVKGDGLILKFDGKTVELKDMSVKQLELAVVSKVEASGETFMDLPKLDTSGANDFFLL